MGDRRNVPPPQEAYVLADYQEWEAAIAQRTVDGPWSAFFLPYLRPGMSLLDCGCGPGSITLGFAEAVAPGQVVGIDIQPGQVGMARELAQKRGVTNARFEEASVYDLPFPDGSFDAVFAAQVLFHLADPARALREMRRVLKPEGIVGIADNDAGSSLLAPATPLLEEMSELEFSVLRHLGADPFMARRHRQLLLEAGFALTEAGAVAVSSGAPDAIRRTAAIRKTRFLAPTNQETAISQGWADRAKLDAMVAELHAWSERPDAFSAVTFCTTIGWNTGSE